MLSHFARLAAYLGHGRVRNLLVGCGLLVGIVLASGATWLILDLRRAALAEAERDLTNLSFVLSDEIARNLQALNLVQIGLIEQMQQTGIDTPEEFERRMTSWEVHQNLKDRITAVAYAAGITLFDCHGKLLNLSAAWPVPAVSIADRDYFRALAAWPAPTFVIGGPIVSYISGQWTMLVARRFTGPGGQLLGVVAASIEPSYFEQLFSRISVASDASFALFSGDGVLLARHPHLEGSMGRSIGATDSFRRALAVLDRAVFTEPGLFDGKERLIAPHSVGDYRLIVTATSTVEAALAGWRGQARTFGGAIVLMELTIGGIVLLGVRHLRGYEKLQAADVAKAAAEAAQARAESELALAQEREHSEHQLQTQWQRFDMTLRNMHQAVCMFDQADNVLVVNRRYNELFGLPPDAVVSGMSYRELTELVVATGIITPGDMSKIREQRRKLIERGSLATFNWELANGRTFTVIHQPMQDGWLTTYEDITEHRKAEARMAHLARHDALTNLPNRVLFRDRLEAALAHARRGRMLALLCLDLDQFKAVNDTLGHPIGDALLQAVAQRLAERIRGTDTVARLGGDEFAIVQSLIEQPSEATSLAGRLIDLLSAPFEVDDHQIVIGTSIGIAYAPQDGLDADQLLRCADLALYRAKVDGRGIYRLFQAEMDARMQARRLLELDLRQAVRVGQLELFYQPLIDLPDKVVVGFEALLRWRHPTQGIVPPGAFIPLAEEIGLIMPIGEWVLRQACAAAASWPGELKVTVNLSPAQFKSRNLVAAAATALRVSGLLPSRLELEVTETAMLHDTDATLATLHELRALGVRIAMDDFGTGYSSLSYLRRFPFDRVKIDQSFVRELGKRQDCGAIVRAVAGLSNELGMATTAEGVETQEQLDTVIAAGCTQVQGYLFSPAVPESAVRELLRRMQAGTDGLPHCGADPEPATEGVRLPAL